MQWVSAFSCATYTMSCTAYTQLPWRTVKPFLFRSKWTILWIAMTTCWAACLSACDIVATAPVPAIIPNRNDKMTVKHFGIPLLPRVVASDCFYRASLEKSLLQFCIRFWNVDALFTLMTWTKAMTSWNEKRFDMNGRYVHECETTQMVRTMFGTHFLPALRYAQVILHVSQLK